MLYTNNSDWASQVTDIIQSAAVCHPPIAVYLLKFKKCENSVWALPRFHRQRVTMPGKFQSPSFAHNSLVDGKPGKHGNAYIQTSPSSGKREINANQWLTQHIHIQPYIPSCGPMRVCVAACASVCVRFNVHHHTYTHWGWLLGNGDDDDGCCKCTSGMFSLVSFCES